MNIAPTYPNLVPLAQQPATEAARRDSAIREPIPQPAASSSGNTDNQLNNSSDTPQRYINLNSNANSDTYSLSSLKNNSVKNGSTDTTLPSSETVTAASDQSRRNGQTSSEGDDASSGSEEDKKKAQQKEQAIKDLKSRDAEVRTHEQAHQAAGGQYASAPSFDMTKGPDGKDYATGGHVNIDVSPVSNDPQATLNKMRQIKSAALAPAEPSAQDRKVAAQADATAAAAQRVVSNQSITKVNTNSGKDVAGSNSEQSSGVTNTSFGNPEMLHRGQVILARYQLSGRPQAQTALTTYS
ncbi:putative metalloprotease CJM1_0395 family protein [uncultured Tolumonas sp.]|uniref:putative metalloprotease CJM1_0395 family protein n=1 Tax=uncultured Tolumonas sp. TaxID=263765 RepID=UPI002A0A8564|nr:putative metalloprotease CJM1_0395 family protein [uncultured Tolumonas sp.]